MHFPAFNSTNFPVIHTAAFNAANTPGIVVNNIERNITRPNFAKTLSNLKIKEPTRVVIPRVVLLDEKMPLALRGYAFLYFENEVDAREAAKKLRGHVEYYNEW